MRTGSWGLARLTRAGRADRRTRVAGATTAPVVTPVRLVVLGLVLGCAAPALMGARAAAAQQIPVRVGGVASSLVGVPFDLPLEVDLSARADKLGSFAARITWNPAVLSFLGGRDADFGRMTVNTDSAGGVIRLTGANPGGVGGKVVLGVARFVPLAASNDTIRLDVTELYAAGTFADLLPSAVWANQPYCPAVGRYGDIDGNQTVNSADALQALSHAVGLPISGNAALGDVDGNGVTDARDALLMLAAGIGLDVSGFRVFLIAPGACAVPKRPLLAMMPGNLTMDVGQQAQYVAFASDSAGAGVAVTDISWQTSDTLVARVTADGVVTAVGPGAAVISVRRTSGTRATATVTVLQRHTHWVDALASPEQQNQLGAPELPFRTIPQALAYADPGDTVRVRSGRYDDSLMIDRPVVLMGDTAGGKPRPLISAYRYFYTGVTIRTPGRVELHALRVDTLTVGVWVTKVDTLLVHWVEFRAAAQTYQASLYVDTAGVVLVQRSDFFGPGNQYYYANDGIVVDSALVVSVDSSYLAEYGDDAVTLYNVDSVSVRASTIRDNYGYGVYYCTQCYYGAGAASNAVFSRNRFVQNNGGHVYVDNAQSVRFDHNRAVGGGFNGYNVYGDTAVTLVTLLGDSLVTRDYGTWLYLSAFDSLAVDSSVIVVRDAYYYGYANINGGRAVSVRDARFLEITGQAINIHPWPQDSTALLLRRVAFRGPDSSACDRCGYGVIGDSVNLDADSVTVTNLSYGFNLNHSRVLLQHGLLRHYQYGLYLSCGSASVTTSSFVGGTYYGVWMAGCGGSDFVSVTNSQFSDHPASYYGRAINSSGVGATVVSGSQFTNNYYAIAHSCGQLRVSNVTATGGYYGVDGDGCALTDTLQVDQSSFTRFYYGGYLQNGTAKVTNSTFTDTEYGLYLPYSLTTLTDNQFVRPRSYGVYVNDYYANGYSDRLLRNTVSCDAYGAQNAYGVYAYHYYSGSPDTLELANNTVSGCLAGLVTSGSYARTWIRTNGVTLPAGGYKGIVGDADSLLQIVANTVSGPAQYGAVWVEAGPRRAEVDSNTVSGAVEAGITLLSVDSLYVRDNTISNVAPGTCCLPQPTAGIMLESSSPTNLLADVRRNRMTRTTSGIVIQRDYQDPVTVTVDSNAIRGADSMGVWVRYYSRALLRYNAIDSSGIDGVRLSDNYLALPAAVINMNNFTRSQRYGVRNLSTYAVDATGNWWEDAWGPDCEPAVGCDYTNSAGDSVSTYVTFSGFLTTPVTTVLPAPGLVATALLASPALTSAAPTTRTLRVWERPSSVPVPRERARPPVSVVPGPLTAPAAPAATPALRRLEALGGARVNRLSQRRAEQVQLLEQQDARRAAREQQRAVRERERAAREAERPAPAPPRRPQ